MEYFKFFLDDTCMAYVAEQPNLYALAKDGKIINTSAKKIEQFFGIFPCRAYPMYRWNFLRFPLIADVMFINCFQVLLRYVHLNNDAEISPVITRIMTHFSRCLLF